MFKTVFTNGCFDVIHMGHIDLLKFCKNMGEKVVIGLNSDASVRKLKGDTRPINNEIDRMNLLLSIKYVDEVIIFNENTPYELISTVKPDLLVKGGDYDSTVTDKNDPKYVVGRDIVKSINIFKYRRGYSTTNILSKI